MRFIILCALFYIAMAGCSKSPEGPPAPEGTEFVVQGEHISVEAKKK